MRLKQMSQLMTNSYSGNWSFLEPRPANCYRLWPAILLNIHAEFCARWGDKYEQMLPVIENT